MTTTTTERESARGLAEQWPSTLPPHVLAAMDLPTPFLVTDLGLLAGRVRRFTAALPGVRPFYAVKCNPAPEVLVAVADQGASFEIASLGELELLQGIGVDPADVLYSNTVKPPSHVAGAARAGVWRFAVDSEGELHKIARHAPGSAVYLRIRVDDSTSIFPLSEKFGVEAHQASSLLRHAEHLGLEPYGLTFHVGSQCTTPAAWARAIGIAGEVMRQVLSDGIRLRMLDIGGGFPAGYGAPVPAIEEVGAVVTRAVEELLPYRPALVCAEPGRHLVAESSVMVASVLGRADRAGAAWLYTDVGAYHGMIETQQAEGGWTYPLWSSRADHGSARQVPFTVTGPTCDSADTMFHDVLLPVTMAEGDRLFIASAGAYTLSYASHFNGFPPPSTAFVG